MSNWKTDTKTMLEKGQDPKDYLIKVCKEECTAKK